MMRQDRLSVGVDMVSVLRMEATLARWGRRFLERIYTDQEITYCLERAHPALSLAARFAAKEAFFKAVSRTLTRSLAHKSIEVVVDERGIPDIKAHGRALEALGESRAALSISHERDHAIAVVITYPEVKV